MVTNLELPRDNNPSAYARCALRFIIEIACTTRDLFKIEHGQIAEFLALLASFVDRAVSIDTGGTSLWPVFGFRFTNPANGKEALILPQDYSSWHFWIYPLIELMKDEPRLFDIPTGDLDELQFEEICMRLGVGDRSGSR